MKVFNTFFMGGYECADHVNRSGFRVNLLKETQHDIRVYEDYKNLVSIGITTVREGICWSNVEKSPNIYDFSEVSNRIKIAEEFGIQQIWDLVHFGYPDDIYPTHPNFTSRFENLCAAFAYFYESHSEQPLFVVPFNEISFLSWHSGDVRGTTPFLVNSGWDIKYHLCKAAISGIKILKEILPTCTIVLVEPLIGVHGVENICSNNVIETNENQFQAMDIIAGRLCPELGGSEDFLEILGFNYYYNCQWKIDGEPMHWPDIENVRIPLSSLINQAYTRYKKPLFLSETGHFGNGRIQWIEEVSYQCNIAIDKGVPLLGICIYPVTDRPDWDDLKSYSNCGIWDLDSQLNRIPNLEYIECIKHLHNSFLIKLNKITNTTSKLL